MLDDLMGSGLYEEIKWKVGTGHSGEEVLNLPKGLKKTLDLSLDFWITCTYLAQY